jgi:hypothetical protein
MLLPGAIWRGRVALETIDQVKEAETVLVTVVDSRGKSHTQEWELF